MRQSTCCERFNAVSACIRHGHRLHLPQVAHAHDVGVRRPLLTGARNVRKIQCSDGTHSRQFKRAQAQRRNPEQSVLSNWNGTVELPVYNFGEEVLQEGSFGGDVLELQRFLHDQGYFPRLKETPDGYTGYFGDVTKEALQAWQEDYHLAADGRFGQSCRQAVARRQEQVQQQHMVRHEQAVQAEPASWALSGRNVAPVQIAGFAFLLGGVVMFAYQIWAWWRHTHQATAYSEADESSQDNQHEQLGKWRGTISHDRTRSPMPSPSYASHSAFKHSPAAHRYDSAAKDYPRPSSPPTPLVRPASAGNASHRSSSVEDLSGPAVSLDGYPRYTPQWGVGVPEKRKAGPPTPVRKEPSDRARAVMTRPGTPAYPKAAGKGPRAAPSDRNGSKSAMTAVRPKPSYEGRPRSPNPIAMPESLTTAPPLKPTLDPSAKSWIEIAVSQRGPVEKTGPRAEGRSQHGTQSASQASPGSHGSGVAQILSVDQERQSQLGRSQPRSGNANGKGNGNGGGNGNSRESNGRSVGNGAQGNGVSTKKGGGVSLFGSYKAPIKRQ